jgi:anaphase-promoting complex subunit 2
MLINIYGNQEQFMEDYRRFLSKKLISNSSFEVSNELKDLEMLKKRFGETNVHKCEVMIRDV